MDFGKLIKRSWEITTKYRYLWWLSLLTVLGGVANEGGSGGSFNLSSSSGQIDPDIINSVERGYDKAVDYFFIYLPIIITVGIIVLVIGIALFIIGLIAKGGFIQEIVNIESKKPTSFFAAFNQGKKYALNIFLTRLLFAIISIALFIVAIPLLLILFLFFIITIPIFIVAIIALGVLAKNAQTLVVLKNLGPIEAIKASWQLLIAEWSNLLLMSLINWAISIGLAVVVLILLLFILAIAAAIMIPLIILKNTLIIIIVAIPLGLIIYAVFLFIGSLINTFFTSYWTLGVHDLIIPKKTKIAKK